MTTIRETSTTEDALGVLKIRNEVRAFMTRHRTEIAPDEQREWFAARAANNIHLYAIETGDQMIGYGLIQTDADMRSRGESHAALTGAVTEDFRGKGYGRLIFAFLLAESWILGARPWLEVLTTNAAAIALYHSLGFRETSRTGDVITMMHFK